MLPLYTRVVVDAHAPQAVVLPCKAWGANESSSEADHTAHIRAWACADSALGVELREGDRCA